MCSRCVGCHGKSKHIWWTTYDWMASRLTPESLGWRGGKAKEAEKWSQGCESHPVDLCSLAGWEWRGLGSIVPFLSLLWVASVGLLQPLWVSVWHRLVSFWEQTEIWTSRGRGRGRGVSWCLLPKACVSIDGFIFFFKAFCFYIPSPFSQK